MELEKVENGFVYIRAGAIPTFLDGWPLSQAGDFKNRFERGPRLKLNYQAYIRTMNLPG